MTCSNCIASSCLRCGPLCGRVVSAATMRPAGRRGQVMKIARIETFLFDPRTAKNLLFCRVETESGIHGWGEAYVTPGKEQVIENLLQVMAKYMIGRSAFNIRHTAQVMF